MDWEVSQEVEIFAEAARNYCDVVELAHEFILPERLARCAAVTARLYAAALYLPFEEKPEEHDEPPVAREVDSWPGFEELSMFWQVPDAYEWGAPTVGSLNETLLGIYRMVKRGLMTFDLAHDQNDTLMYTVALWHWRTTMESYWGALAVDALRALNRALQKVSDGQRDF